MNWPQFDDDLVFDRAGKYLGSGYHDNEHLVVDPGDGYSWEVSLLYVTKILNISDPCMPSSYYRCEWTENKSNARK
jgi:hypothetical protein